MPGSCVCHQSQDVQQSQTLHKQDIRSPGHLNSGHCMGPHVKLTCRLAHQQCLLKQKRSEVIFFKTEHGNKLLKSFKVTLCQSCFSVTQSEKQPNCSSSCVDRLFRVKLQLFQANSWELQEANDDNGSYSHRSNQSQCGVSVGLNSTFNEHSADTDSCGRQNMADTHARVHKHTHILQTHSQLLERRWNKLSYLCVCALIVCCWYLTLIFPPCLTEYDGSLGTEGGNTEEESIAKNTIVMMSQNGWTNWTNKMRRH